jgi:uncharacterized protein YndB with AHSA1/START domain
MASPSSAPSTKIEVRRMFVAPADKVFAAWSQRENLEKWMCRFPRYEARFRGSDPAPGATLVMDVKNPEGETFQQTVTYRDLEPPKKLTFTWDWQKFSAAGDLLDEAHDTLVTVEFQPRGTFTEVILTHEDLRTAEQREAHAKGWNACFDTLAEYLKP